MNISIIGSGYVGLVSAVCLAKFNHNITCLDKSPRIIRNLKKGKTNFYEPMLEELLKKNINKIKFTNSFRVASKNNIIFFCVDTPISNNGNADLTNLKSAINSIIKHSYANKFLIIKSTTPVGTNHQLSKDLMQLDFNFEIVSNPEFLREGNAVNDFIKPDRIIVGTNSSKAKRIMREVYKPLLRKTKLIFMSPKSAEITNMPQMHS